MPIAPMPAISPYNRLGAAYIQGMKHLAAPVLALSLIASPLAAQDEEPPSLMEQGAKLFLEGLMKEMEPALQELESMTDEIEPMLKDFAAQMGPALTDLMGKVEDWSVYHPPEMLENGDIILRRKTPEEIQKIEEANPEIDL
ncbi:hypothetical protein [Pelagimonas varians]|uniref:AAA+ family ATPase n=1 Tax=Pelagimonas varians TaxID=696760 RepID=A0A238KC31_9RHOB|nr:hypothetical protein [Pelagimonas varians]PYG30035.1 hypothetical protein C8N36_107202 [Pelagimonas varians]SMX40391.1 hypothetical protein PEV8663_01994 [Pelagimonas varians]